MKNFYEAKLKMLKHTLISAEGILILEPSSPLETADFEAVAHDIDPYIADHGTLSGVLIVAKAFPGWMNLESAIAHLRLIEKYHQRIKKLAIVSDNSFLEQLPKIRCSPIASRRQALFRVRIRRRAAVD